MITDGVDVADPAAVRRWLADREVSTELIDDDENFDAAFEEAGLLDVDLKEALGLPDRLAPLRLPSQTELAAAARLCAPLAKARDLAIWVGDGRDVDGSGVLSPADSATAARVLGLAGAEGAGPASGVLPEIAHLWDLACAVEFIELDDLAVVGPAVEVWPDGPDEDVLDIWATALATALSGLPLDADLHGEPDLDFTDSGVAVLLALFLARNAGVPPGMLGELIHESATADLRPMTAATKWATWTTKHGDPTSTVLTRLAELGAVQFDGDLARLTPLAQWAMREQMLDSGVDVPLLPDAAHMTAADLVAAAGGFTEEELVAESTEWLASRDPESAARDLLEIAAEGEPVERMCATAIATRIGARAEPRWRQAIEDRRLRPYAKIALSQLAGIEPPGTAEGLEQSVEDLAWLLTDSLAAWSKEDPPAELVNELTEAVPAGHEQGLFEAMWRLPHPAAYDVLTLIGTHHPDRTVAKGARKAAFKAASRNT
jgi:hypothetical protein